MLFRYLLGRMLKEGSLVYEDTRGRSFKLGDSSPPACRIRVHKRSIEWTVALDPALRIGEAFMEGDFTVVDGGLEDVIVLIARNFKHLERHWLVRFFSVLARRGRWLKQHNPMHRAKANVAHHYDLSGRLYDLFLDRDRQYSCAYFTHAHDDIERAQADKKRHIAAKLRLDAGAGTILDIGSGWGGLGMYLAKVSGGRVVGVTLSEEQHKLSRQGAQEAGLAGNVDFRLQDYRTLDERFDRIVSVGMFEHVGKRNYREFFGKLHALLDENGVALLHTIARFNEPGPIHPFIRKYVFPGADVPTLSEVLPEIEKSGLLVTDIEVLRLHYAETLRLWRKRFEENRAAIRALYDERFCRMWEAYLVGCEMGFRYQGLMVAQIQLARRQEALPLTRDYMADWERRQEAHERRPQAAE
jgi:cyclopropane-fatty-acyl-phospholipid synthase